MLRVQDEIGIQKLGGIGGGLLALAALTRPGDTVLCEGSETRAFCMRDPQNPDRIKAIPIPADIVAKCS